MSDIASLSAASHWWETNDILALVLVAIGVVGEGIAQWLPKEQRERPAIENLGKRAWLVLVLGLAAEGVCQPNKDAADALIVAALNERAAATLGRSVCETCRRGGKAKTGVVPAQARKLTRNIISIILDTAQTGPLPTPLPERQSLERRKASRGLASRISR
jgi:hypothetical protein